MILKKKETLRNPHNLRMHEHIFVVDQEEKLWLLPLFKTGYLYDLSDSVSLGFVSVWLY